jgi:acyl-CoA synthetase (AMP-forming)/AMP-acid ligase II
MTKTGHARVVGRLKDMIIRGGENVYPREIEDFLYSHPAIQEAQLVGVPDPRMGEELAAWIVLKEGQSLTEDELKAHCKGKVRGIEFLIHSSLRCIHLKRYIFSCRRLLTTKFQNTSSSPKNTLRQRRARYKSLYLENKL